MGKEMSKDAKEQLSKANREAKDWRGICRVCKEPLLGTLVELSEHMANCHGKPSQ